MNRQIAPRVLVVEDVDHKFDDLRDVISNTVRISVSLERSTTLVDALRTLANDSWDLLILDISMDIASGGRGPTRDGHANLGGMDIVEHMFLLKREVPTLIVTGFDLFVRGSVDSDAQVAQTFGDIERQASALLGPKLVGCIRYGISGWEQAFARCLIGALG